MWAIISNAFQLTEETEIESEGSAGCKSIRLKNNNNFMLQSVLLYVLRVFPKPINDFAI